MAKNKWGWGSFSTPVAILAATIPSAPGTAVTSIDAGTGGVSLTWAIPTSLGGVTIAAYTIEIKGADLTWRTDTSCDGSVSGVISTRTCIVPMANLVDGATHNLAFDSLVEVRVAAGNIRGLGPTSAVNTAGARIRQIPA